jgi:probable HAF family extracellular repeat protein
MASSTTTERSPRSTGAWRQRHHRPSHQQPWGRHGYYTDSSGGPHGFIYDDGAFTTLDAPGASDTTPQAINDRGDVAGTYYNGSYHGFIYDDGTFTTLDAPGALATHAQAIDNRGDVAGYYYDGSDHGFVYDNGTFTTLNAPGATSTRAQAIDNRGDVAGIYTDSSGSTHGFVYDNGTFTTLDAPGATDTFPQAINNRGDVAGYYSDSVSHAFVATPSHKFEALGDLLSDHARQGSKSDFLPGASAISGGSPQSANPSGTMDQTPAAGTSFAPSGDLGGAQLATQLLSQDNGLSPGTG